MNMTDQNSFINRMLTAAQRHKTVLLALAVLVVFCTTYLLILPAIAVDHKTAQEMGGYEMQTEDMNGQPPAAGAATDAADEQDTDEASAEDAGDESEAVQ